MHFPAPKQSWGQTERDTNYQRNWWICCLAVWFPIQLDARPFAEQQKTHQGSQQSLQWVDQLYLQTKQQYFFFTLLLTKFGILLRSLWVNLVVCASSSIPKDIKFLTYSSFKSLTTNVEPGSIASCPNTKLTILSYTCARLPFISMSWQLSSLSILIHWFQRYLLHFAW